jgi:hypothetical protein
MTCRRPRKRSSKREAKRGRGKVDEKKAETITGCG